jgi:large subunit ribosomal protein L22
MAAVEKEQQTVRAQAKWVRSSARKARLVTDLIRGRTVPEARTILAFSQRAVARDIEKVLRSAIANAESRPDLRWDGDDLVVVRAHADEGRTLKRARARARGRVASIKKRTCHITIELAQVVAADAATRHAPHVPPMTVEEETPEVAVAEPEEPSAEPEALQTEPATEEVDPDSTDQSTAEHSDRPVATESPQDNQEEGE